MHGGIDTPQRTIPYDRLPQTPFTDVIERGLRRFRFPSRIYRFAPTFAKAMP